ncbi:MAG: hypothetical protein ACRENC_05845 [Gemmatimonadaceae bacterium]
MSGQETIIMYARKTTITALAVTLAALSLAACKKNQAASAADTTAVAAANDTTSMAPAAAPTLSVASVDLGKSLGADKKIAAPTTTFGPRDTIYAAVNTEGAATGTLSAKWSFLQGTKETVIDSASKSITPTGPATTEFHITKKSAWPAGQYKVDISLNGASASVKNFEVKK